MFISAALLDIYNVGNRFECTDLLGWSAGTGTLCTTPNLEEKESPEEPGS